MAVNHTGTPRLPFFFGEADSPLFGCYDQPLGGPARDRAVVLCHPMGQEYIRAHRAFVQLATRLARVGFPVLRFDYFGCGDSAGDAEEARLARWLADVHRAIDEARRRSGRTRVSLVGLRLGAALAALAARERDDVDSIVLWAPLLEGRSYLRELCALQAELLRLAYVRPEPGTERQAADEVLGFVLPEPLREEIEALDLLAANGRPAREVLIVDRDASRAAALERALAAAGARVESRSVPGPGIWLAEPVRGLIPHRTIACIVEWLSRSLP